MHVVSILLQPIINSYCLAYLDDVIVFSTSFDSHLKNLGSICDAFQYAGLKLNPTKCEFVLGEVKKLGHRFSASGVSSDKKNHRSC